MFEEATSERNPSGVPKREKETVRCEQGRTRSTFDTKHGTSGVWCLRSARTSFFYVGHYFAVSGPRVRGGGPGGEGCGK